MSSAVDQFVALLDYRARDTRLSTGAGVVRGLTEGCVTLNIEALGGVVKLKVLEDKSRLVRRLGDDVRVPVNFTPSEGNIDCWFGLGQLIMLCIMKMYIQHNYLLCNILVPI